jgi:glycosyltransferase involved in cell wall biosynthesis
VIDTRPTARRLCIVTPTQTAVHAGGAEYQIDCLLEVLRSLNRHEVFYLAALTSERAESDTYTLVRIGKRTTAPRFGYLTQALPLYRALRGIRPNAIYQRVASGYTAICTYYALRNQARLVFHVAHDSDVTPAQSLEGRNPLRRFLEKRSVEYGIRNAACIVVQTAHQARLLERYYHRAADAIIPNFHPPAREAIDKGGQLTVAWIASIKPWKQPEAFVDLASALQDLADVRFVMIGPQAAGPGERHWIEELLRRIRRTPNLEYWGPRTQDEVNQLLARAHVFVNTSCYEGFPNTFIQAWMRETAVVSLHVDPDHKLTDETLGVYCSGSVERLAQAVRNLVSNPAARAEYTSRARQYARMNHSLENARSLIRLLDADVPSS